MLADFWLTEWARRGTGVNSQWAHSEAKLYTGWGGGWGDGWVGGLCLEHPLDHVLCHFAAILDEIKYPDTDE